MGVIMLKSHLLLTISYLLCLNLGHTSSIQEIEDQSHQSSTPIATAHATPSATEPSSQESQNTHLLTRAQQLEHENKLEEACQLYAKASQQGDAQAKNGFFRVFNLAEQQHEA